MLKLRRNSYLPAWVMSQLSGERMYQMFASLSEQERNRFLNQVQANPTFKGVERLQEEPSASTAADEAAVSEPPASAATLQEMGMDFMDTVATEDLPVPASDAEAVHPLVVAAPPAQTPAKTSFPPAAGEARQTPKASFPPAAGESRQSEVDRAPSLAAEAPASRVGSVINDADGNPLFCLVQLWACRKRCESCENPPLGTHGKSPGANPGMRIGERIGASPLGAESSPSARGPPLPVLPLLLHFRADKA